MSVDHVDELGFQGLAESGNSIVFTFFNVQNRNTVVGTFDKPDVLKFLEVADQTAPKFVFKCPTFTFFQLQYVTVIAFQPMNEEKQQIFRLGREAVYRFTTASARRYILDVLP